MSGGFEYPASVMIRARELREAGYSLRDTVSALEHETGYKPSTPTIVYWTDPQWTDRLLSDRRRARARLAAAASPFGKRSPEYKMERIRTLAERRVSQRSIAALMEIDFGDRITEDQVRRSLASGRYPTPGRRPGRPVSR